MEIIELLRILKEGESTVVEFKESLNKELKKTVCKHKRRQNINWS